MAKSKAKCHPDRDNQGRGYCAACYSRFLYKRKTDRMYGRKAECHPDQKHEAYGLCQTCYAARRRKLYPGINKAIQFKSLNKRVGLTNEQYNFYLEKQNNACAICKSVFTNKSYRDHDHVTGKFRGILCNRCNTGLGKFQDNVVLLEKAINYLNEAQV